MTQIVRRRFLILSMGPLFMGGLPQSARALNEEHVNAAARTFMEHTSAPGLSIGVVTSAGAQVFSYGVASLETGAPVEGATLFELGSISKTFTVALASYAAEVGVLDWTQSPGHYVSELRGTSLDHVTLLNLATHTTGGMPLQLPESLKTNADLMTYFRDWEPSSPPGTVRTYANPSIGLLGIITARALKGDFAELVREHVLLPLGLQHTFYQVPPSEQKHYAQGYTRDGQPVRVSAALLSTEAYGVRSTAKDLLQFLKAQLGMVEADTALRRALAATHVGYFRAGPMTQALIWEWYQLPVAEVDLDVGNGDAMVLKSNPVMRLEPPQPPPADALINKTGATNGFGAYIAFIPGRQIGLVVLANRNHATATRLMLAEQVLAAFGVQGVPRRS